MLNNFFHSIRHKCLLLSLHGNRFNCPVCGQTFRKFNDYGVNPRPNAMCPNCKSLERHRLLWVALDRLWSKYDVPRGGKMLHVAPEKSLEVKFKKSFDYLSVDLDEGRAMMAMDITSINFPDEHFDAVVCNHVLEHIPDDRKALAELYRVLKTGGWASIQVPMEGDVTSDAPGITDPQERERLFGQPDHVRQYGTDFLERLKGAGFETLTFSKAELIDLETMKRISVECENEVVFALKK